MKKVKVFFLFGSIISFATTIYAQTSITPLQAKKYINQSVTVCNRIYNGNVQHVEQDGSVIMTMGKNEKDRELLIVFPQNVRNRMSFDPQKKLTNHQICITGEIVKYNGSPAIVIKNEGEIETKD